MSPRVKHVLAAIAAVAAVIVTVLNQILGGTAPPPPARPAPFPAVRQLGGPGNASIPLAVSPVPLAEHGLHEKADPQSERTEQNLAMAPARQPALPVQPPLAAVNVQGCKTMLVRNYSSRNGQPILLFVLHYTVSTDNGWTGVQSVVGWFDNPAAQASSNYVIDRRVGACALTVAEASKAWAQVGYNSVGLSVEVTANGHEGKYVEGAGRDRLLYLMIRGHRIYGLPYRRGKTTDAGCQVLRTGYVMHHDLGQCGGGHFDVQPYHIGGLIGQAQRLDRACSSVTRWRRAGRPESGRATARRRKDYLKGHNLRCRPHRSAANRIVPRS